MDASVDQSKRRFVQATAAGAGLAMTGNALAKPAMSSLSEYERFDATGLAEHIRLGHITALEALDAATERADARQALNAFALRHDEQARDAAKALSSLGRAARLEKAKQAPLLGVPFALKDLGVTLKGTVTTNGCAFFKEAVANQNTTLVQRYLAAGLNIFGKTTSPEFGQTATTESKLFGLTRNPWSPQLSSGGSSGGAAVAVASGVIPLAHASDGGGSIRIPASHCGLFGLKPSRGRVPAGPAMLEGWLGLSMNHAISRSVRDSALLLELTQGAEPGSRTAPPSQPFLAALKRPPKKLRIALMEENLFGYPVHPDCLQAARSAAKLCESLGHQVELAPKQLLGQELVGQMFAGMGIVTASGMLQSVRAREKALGRAAREDEFESINWGSLQKAKTYTAEQVLAARAAFDQVGRSFDLFFQSFDLILSPVTAAPPPPLGAMSLNQPFDDYVKSAVMASPFTAMFNMSGHPAMSVPLHWNDAGIPLGAQFAGPYGGEALLLALAAQLEQAAPWQHKRPKF
jgi:Asp-tRNA(Asn)/Glu-tRNA(Gln) amidotransferase A subunit family amidase